MTSSLQRARQALERDPQSTSQQHPTIPSPRRARPGRGFTLLELLVAIFIAAIIFAMGYGAINQALKNHVGLQEQQARLLELQNAVRTMEQDFIQLAPRPVREPIGGNYQPALLSSNAGSSGGLSDSGSRGSASTISGGSGSTPLVALTRAGWTNPAGLQRPGLQRVAYYFQDGVLRREYWSVLDPTQASTAVRRDVLTHLKSVSLRFLDTGGSPIQQPGQSDQSGSASSGNWSPVWPPVNHAGQDDRRRRPIAVEITLETEDWGKIVRIVEIAG
jgi:general secretion pathway protein J